MQAPPPPAAHSTHRAKSVFLQASASAWLHACAQIIAIYAADYAKLEGAGEMVAVQSVACFYSWVVTGPVYMITLLAH